MDQIHNAFDAIFIRNAKPTLRSNGVKEWTIMACIFTVDHLTSTSTSVLAIGSGVKVLPSDKLSTHGDVIHDCHAEILARRAFIRWLFEEMLRILNDSTFHSKLLNYDASKCKFYQKDSVRLHLYTSQAPCGDASITALAASQNEEQSASLKSLKKKINVLNTHPNFERGRWDYSKIGALRTKPGRADSIPSLSMSCSDKIAMWNVVGIQGALAMHFLLHPLYLSDITIGDYYIKVDIQRALNERISQIQKDLPLPYKIQKLDIHDTSEKFSYSLSETSNLYDKNHIAPAASCAYWYVGSNTEVVNNGRLRGSNKSSTKHSSICKRSILSIFRNVATYISAPLANPNLTFRQLKDSSIEYQKAKEILLNGPFEAWLKTGRHYEDFV